MDFLASGARSLLNLELSRAQLAAFQIYADELQAWNAKFNLTAIKDSEGIQIKHFLDSLSLLKALCPAAAGEEDGRLRAADPGLRARLVDVGTGAGFPGLPLKIVCPQLQLTLVEATGKKATFCEAVVEKLNLSGVLVVKARAEEVGRDPSHREQYDWAVARAVAEMPVLAEYLLPLVKVGGHALAQKGKDAEAEIEAAKGAIKKLGGELRELKKVIVPGLDEDRYLVIIKKISPTPETYPRRPGVPSKRPLG